MGGDAASADIQAVDTFPKLLLHNAKSMADRPAIREKEYGIWQSWTWGEVLEEVQCFANGLKKLGIKRGQKIAVVGDNRPRLYWSMVAVQSLGGVPVPVYQDSVVEEMSYVLDHADVVAAVVQNQEQVDKVMQIAEEVKSIKLIVHDEERGLKDYQADGLHSFASVQEMGRKILNDNPQALEKWHKDIAKTKGEDVSILLYTSGTTGKPKGVMLSFNNILISAQNGNRFDDLGADEEVLAYLPMAWIGDHIFSFGQSYAAGFCVSCPESPETVLTDRREIGPTYFFAPPRVYENLLTEIMVRMEDAGTIKKKMFEYFLLTARQYGEQILNGEPVSLKGRLLYGLGELCIYGPLKNWMGFTRVKVAYTAGEAIGPELFSFYRALGVNLKQLYGQTESSVYITAQPDGEISAETVGTPVYDVEIKIKKNGEVQYRSPGVFVGYYKNDKATKETKTKDGWVNTGDAGFFDTKGHLKIIDRAKDVGELNDGSMFAPKYIENKLKFFPNVKEVVAFGNGQDICCAFVNIDLVSVSNWAERNNIAYASYQELAAHPEVYKMIEGHVDEVNQSLAKEPRVSGSQISRFLVLHKELDADDGELTRTQKVRRNFVAERYAPLVDALFSGKETAFISTEVTFEDGRKGLIEADLKIKDMQTHTPVKFDEAAE
jgi:long-chain acyl-CoA synthetase